MEIKEFRHELVGRHVRTDNILISRVASIESVLNTTRNTNISDQITYFYVIDDERRLVGVLPIRRLLSAGADQIVEDVMVPNVVSISADATLADALRHFAKHKYLSLPVVGDERKFIGVLDVTLFTGKNLNPAESQKFDYLFETIGVRASFLKYTNPFSSFARRSPWLVPTLLSGIFSAILASFFEATLAENIIFAFFLTLILGLGESVSIQSLTITVQQLRLVRPDWKWYRRTVLRELPTAFMLGSSAAFVVLILVVLWKGSVATGVAIGLSIVLSLTTASFLGLSIPALLHTTKLDPKVAAGPLVLGLADVSTLLYYFTLATLLGRG